MVHRTFKQIQTKTFQILIYEILICFNDVPHMFSCISLKYFGNKYGVHGSRFVEQCGSSRNHPKSIAICPGTLIIRFGIIEPHSGPIKIFKNKEKYKHHVGL